MQELPFLGQNSRLYRTNSVFPILPRPIRLYFLISISVSSAPSRKNQPSWASYKGRKENDIEMEFERKKKRNRYSLYFPTNEQVSNSWARGSGKTGDVRDFEEIREERGERSLWMKGGCVLFLKISTPKPSPPIPSLPIPSHLQTTIPLPYYQRG